MLHGDIQQGVGAEGVHGGAEDALGCYQGDLPGIEVHDDQDVAGVVSAGGIPDEVGRSDFVFIQKEA